MQALVLQLKLKAADAFAHGVFLAGLVLLEKLLYFDCVFCWICLRELKNALVFALARFFVIVLMGRLFILFV